LLPDAAISQPPHCCHYWLSQPLIYYTRDVFFIAIFHAAASLRLQLMMPRH